MTALLLLFRGEIPTLSFTFLAKNWATEGLSLVLMEPARLEEEPAGAGEEEPAAAGAGEEEESDEGSCCAKQTKRSLICLARGIVFWSA